MKKNIPAVIAMLFSAAILLGSCAVNKNSVVTQQPDVTNPGKSKTSGTCFIQLNDGTIQHYSSLKLVTGVLTTPHLVADDKVIINTKNIMAYQDNELYAVSPKILTTTKNSLVATDALPGFAVKVLSGKVNVYCRKYYNGANAVDEYFLQHGNESYIIAYSKDVLKSMLKDDTKALEFFNGKTKISPESKKLLATVKFYNSNQLLTKN